MNGTTQCLKNMQCPFFLGHKYDDFYFCKLKLIILYSGNRMVYLKVAARFQQFSVLFCVVLESKETQYFWQYVNSMSIVLNQYIL